ncbi:hypothetical protein FT643_12630 [Ketobacter sp. MCCC 1A13808]|uniref:fatty acid cis/trans isomerase n=1 Tax=Ketobacter sp. MCCC 1A13808 TaxID=2602738 RepID=UPI0012EC1E16|nr:fatty acid cis/trans isomerase [Ketobacter sp. MCCC 1A13808]MVF12986.1 hypothetical protein [Ketobacter sp. MCCC 1A13808]
MHRLFLLFGVLVITGCSTLLASQWDRLYGKSDPAHFDKATTQTTGSNAVNYLKDVKPILDQRCVVCHSCYDSPCQLKLGSYAGITRGATKAPVYDGERLLAADLTRLFQDASSNQEWREKDFFPVLNERVNTPEANINASILAHMLLLKQQHPLPQQNLLPDSFKFTSLDDQQCPDLNELAAYEKSNPLWGMPYALPAISPDQHKTLMLWLSQGATGEESGRTSPELQTHIDKWEAFFNRSSLKSQVVNRYMYEHLFLASLYFNENSNPVYYELVRSSTPPGQPIKRINTRRPYDDPGVEHVYYRLQEQRETPALKTHMPYLLDDSRMARWHTLFYTEDYTITEKPSYDIGKASNPFITFKEIPSSARYRFMLEEAQFTIMGFIKGPVCRGNLALNVINDHFWVTFLSPAAESAIFSDQFLLDNVNQLELPAEASSSSGILNLISYAADERKFFDAMVEQINQKLDGGFKIDLDLLWDGDGSNDNAALTIYRHSDSATVIKGLHGDKPQSAWVISYPLLERIHYLLVAGFDVYGNVGHNLNTRIYMDFLRMEGEFNFITLLPVGYRTEVRNHWYRGSVNTVKEKIFDAAKVYKGKSSVNYQTQQPLDELYLKLRDKLAPVLNRTHDAGQGQLTGEAREAILDLDQVAGIAASLMPQVTILEVADEKKGASNYYTLLSDSAFTNISYLFDEEDRRLPQEDTLTVGYGIIAAYPNLFLRVPQAQMRNFVDRVNSLRSAKDYTALLDEFAIRRTSEQFWEFSDRLHKHNFLEWPVEFALMDYNRLDNK